MTKRLFLFAGYNQNGIVDDALVYYVGTLSKFGEIVLHMDSDCEKTELNKLKKFVLNASATRHGEYDFGSYKRAYIWAKQNLNLAEYDFIYLVNDSVYGPLYDLSRYLDAMENMGHDGFGIVKNPHYDHPHIQSWFVGLNKSVFLTDWFDSFMQSITKLPAKGAITKLYEQGLSKQIIEHRLTWDCLYSVPGRGVYNKVKKLYKSGMPFLKKVAFIRNHGALGRQLVYILRNIDSNTSNAIIKSAKMQYGDKNITKLLTRNPIKIAYRNIKHAIHKLFVEGI